MTPGHRVRFWHRRFDGEPARLAEHERALQQASSGFVLLGRRRRIGHNGWLHGGTRDGAPEAEAWLAPEDLASLGLTDGALLEVRSESGAVVLPARGRDGVQRGTVVVPHGEKSMNVNAVLPSGPAHVERVSGMLHMTGLPVEVRPAR